MVRCGKCAGFFFAFTCFLSELIFFLLWSSFSDFDFFPPLNVVMTSRFKHLKYSYSPSPVMNLYVIPVSPDFFPRGIITHPCALPMSSAQAAVSNRLFHLFVCVFVCLFEQFCPRTLSFRQQEIAGFLWSADFPINF